MALFLLVVLTSLAVGASLHAWRRRIPYGYVRFFAFESTALLVAWNAYGWFHDPFSLSQVLSWILLVFSSALAVHGVYLLRVIGRARARLMEETEVVVRVGAYRYIRHPLYASLMIFGYGVYLKGIDLVSTVLVLQMTVLWIVTARYEERFNLEHLGVPYRAYMADTKMFIPFIL